MLKPIISPDQNNLQIAENNYSFVATSVPRCMMCAFDKSNDCKDIPCSPYRRIDKKEGYFMLQTH